MLRKTASSFIAFTLLVTSIHPVDAQDFRINELPAPGNMVGASVPFFPLSLKGIIVNPKKPLELQFLVDTGNDSQDTAFIKEESNRLIKYFLTGLTVPEGDLWVNLSPYERDRIVPDALGQTELGRDLLAQDYILKQLTASLIYPEKDLGKEFWARVYKKAQEQFGTTNIPVNTFNKVWILPNEAQVYENGNSVYVTKATLKVMLDEDYLATQKNSSSVAPAIASQIIRDLVLPAIEHEINTGKNFAPLRQIFQALILAKWYKETVNNGIIDALYANKNKINGVHLNDLTLKGQIYDRYLQAYKKGVFNFIREEGTAPRKYFSGGTTFNKYKIKRDGAMSGIQPDGSIIAVEAQLYGQKTVLGVPITPLKDFLKPTVSDAYAQVYLSEAPSFLTLRAIKESQTDAAMLDQMVQFAQNSPAYFVLVAAAAGLGLQYAVKAFHEALSILPNSDHVEDYVRVYDAYPSLQERFVYELIRRGADQFSIHMQSLLSNDYDTFKRAENKMRLYSMVMETIVDRNPVLRSTLMGYLSENPGNYGVEYMVKVPLAVLSDRRKRKEGILGQQGPDAAMFSKSTMAAILGAASIAAYRVIPTKDDLWRKLQDGRNVSVFKGEMWWVLGGSQQGPTYTDADPRIGIARQLFELGDRRGFDWLADRLRAIHKQPYTIIYREDLNRSIAESKSASIIDYHGEMILNADHKAITEALGQIGTEDAYKVLRSIYLASPESIELDLPDNHRVKDSHYYNIGPRMVPNKAREVLLTAMRHWEAMWIKSRSIDDDFAVSSFVTMTSVEEAKAQKVKLDQAMGFLEALVISAAPFLIYDTWKLVKKELRFLRIKDEVGISETELLIYYSNQKPKDQELIIDWWIDTAKYWYEESVKGAPKSKGYMQVDVEHIARQKHAGKQYTKYKNLLVSAAGGKQDFVAIKINRFAQQLPSESKDLKSAFMQIARTIELKRMSLSGPDDNAMFAFPSLATMSAMNLMPSNEIVSRITEATDFVFSIPNFTLGETAFLISLAIASYVIIKNIEIERFKRMTMEEHVEKFRKASLKGQRSMADRWVQEGYILFFEGKGQLNENKFMHLLVALGSKSEIVRQTIHENIDDVRTAYFLGYLMDINKQIAHYRFNPDELASLGTGALNSSDAAMVKRDTTKGGIDLNPINIHRIGRTINVHFDPAQLNEFIQGGFDGFTPVIMKVTAVDNPLSLPMPR